MLIFNMGIPRSGTVWAFNVFRHLWDIHQVSYQTRNLNSPGEIESQLRCLEPTDDVLVHFHDITPAVAQLAQRDEVRCFFNYRDPRDVVVSQMQLHNAPFESAVRMTRTAFENLPHACAMPGIMLIPYDHVIQYPEALIFQMATRVGRFVNLDVVRQIAEQTSLDSHRKVMQELSRPASTEFEPAASLNTGLRNIRFDPTHLINDRHIQSGRTGRWREELSSEQQAQVNECFVRELSWIGLGD